MPIRVLIVFCVLQCGIAGVYAQTSKPVTLTQLLYRRQDDTVLQKALATYTSNYNPANPNEKRISYKNEKGKFVLSILYKYSALDSQYYAATITAYYNTNKKSIYGAYTGALLNNITWQQNWADIKAANTGDIIEPFEGVYGVKYHNASFNWVQLGFEKIDEHFNNGKTYHYFGLNKVTVSTQQNMPE